MEEITPIALVIARLKEMSLAAIRNEYLETFGEEPAPSSNKEGLWRRIAFHLQEQRFGGFKPEFETAIKEEISKLQPDKSIQRQQKEKKKRNRRIPMPGTILSRRYKSRTIEVKVLDGGFEYQGKVLPTLSAVAKEITGSHWNGLKFFNL
jgi:hypothetical protein